MSRERRRWSCTARPWQVRARRSIEDTVPQFSRVRLVLSEAQMSGGDGAARPRDGHWTVEAPAALSCEMSDALDEVKSLCHKVSPVKFGGMTRDRVVIVAIGGPS